MIKHDIEQGTPEWRLLRAGMPTASEFDKIITPTGKRCKEATTDNFANRLIAELMMGEPVETFGGSHYMNRGKELEDEAAQFYSLITGHEIEKVGFCTDDAKRYGCSPDRFIVGQKKGLEIKVVAPQTQVAYLLSRKLDLDYFPQIQGNLLVTNYETWDWFSYCPGLPPCLITVTRDLRYLCEMQVALADFHKLLEDKLQFMADEGHINIPPTTNGETTND